MKAKEPELTPEEMTEFNIYAREHYRFCITEAITTAESVKEVRTDEQIHEWALAVFDKLATPRVFLKEKWLKERTDKAWREAAGA